MLILFEYALNLLTSVCLSIVNRLIGSRLVNNMSIFNILIIIIFGQVITPAECLESDSIWESSQKTLLSKDSDNLSESSQKGSMAKDGNSFSISELTTDNDKSSRSAGNISKKLLSVPSVAEWVKHEDISSWTEKTSHACAEVPKQSRTELFEFDTRGVTVINFDETDSHGKSVTTQVEAGEVVAEVAYEGDEDEEFESTFVALMLKISCFLWLFHRLMMAI